MAYRTIAISHATGSGGETIGAAVAGALRFRYVSDDVIVEAAEQANLDVEIVADAERRKSFVARLLGDLATRQSPTLGPSDVRRSLPSEADLRLVIIDVLQEFSAAGEAVIVAHAASFALAGRADVLRVLVTASRDARASRIAEARGVDERAAARVIEREDAGRAQYLRRFYGIDQELPTHFDLVLNTDSLSTDDATAAVVAVAKRG